MKNNYWFKLIELLILFIGIPLFLITDNHIAMKLCVGAIGVIYCLILSSKLRLFTKQQLIGLPKIDWVIISFKFTLLVLVSTIMMYIFNKEKLFVVVKNDLLLWTGITLLYSIFSVYPQEFIYRSFFFKRYKSLFNSELIFITTNACLFAFAHIIFLNGFIIALTLAGGFAFALTFRKSQSLMFTSIEHALYGSWIFTLGVGEYLAFPMPG